MRLTGTNRTPGKSRRFELLGQASPVNPRAPIHSNGRSVAAADADIGRLQKSNAGIEQGGRQVAHVRRRVTPCQSSLIEEVAALPPGYATTSRSTLSLRSVLNNLASSPTVIPCRSGSSW